jgi:hypothetical protein
MPPANPFNALVRTGSLGDVDVQVPSRGPMGYPAVGQEAASPDALAAAGINVNDVAFRNGEFIMMGISNQIAGGVALLPGARVTLARAPSTPLRPLQATIASTICPGLFVDMIRVGAIYLIDGDPIAAETLSEVSFANKLVWPTVQTSQQIEIGILNASAGQILNISVNVLGWRVRP